MNIMRLLIYMFLFVFGISVAKAQVSELEYDLHPPLKIPFAFSGSFGELRATHFHSGVDFKTNGKSGYRIYASDSGYVARVVVSPVGYGRAVYVAHANGLMTVYAHLRNFSDKIEKYVRDKQYQKESWALDISLKKGQIPVKRGEVLGFSGNSGSSGGPHLHYEVRDLKTQEPINPLFYFKAKDNIRPKIQGVYVYDLDNGGDVFSVSAKGYPVVKNGRSYLLKSRKLLRLGGKVGFGVRVKDFMDGSWNTCGVYSLTMFVDDEKKYEYKADRFAFSETAFVNVIKDYKLYLDRHIKVYKSWLPEDLRFQGVKLAEDGGALFVEKDSVYDIRFEICDKAGNKSKLSFKVKGLEQKVVEKKVLEKQDGDAAKKYVCAKEKEGKEKDRQDIVNGNKCIKGKRRRINGGALNVVLSSGTLFADAGIVSSVDTVKGKGFVGDLVYKLGGDYVPLRKKVRVSMAVDSSLIDKAYFVNAVNGDKFSSVATTRDADSLYCRTKNLGRYAVCLDTVAPSVKALGKYRLKHFGNNGKMYFRIKDAQSGVLEYEARVNGKWVLTSYDAKRNLLVCNFDKKRIKTGSKCKFILTVSDNCGNKSRYKTLIYL